MGIGAKVNVYPAGQKNLSAQIGSQEIRIGYGYCSGQEAVAHFGLGTTERVDVEVIFPHARIKLVKDNVPVNQRLTL